MAFFHFTVILEVEEINDDLLDQLYEAGCDDGTVATINGKTQVHFDREAATFEEAYTTAIRDIRKAGAVPGDVVFNPDELTEAA